MPPIEITALRAKRVTQEAPSAGKKALSSRGRVHSVSESYDGRYAEVHIAHGRKAPPKKRNIGPFDERPSSRVIVSKKHAKHFPVGSHVKMTLTPMQNGGDTDEDGDTGYDADQDEE